MVEPNHDYIHWLGKGDDGNQESIFRMYNQIDPSDVPARPNRISFYLFNPPGGLASAVSCQVPILTGQWIHLVGVADSTRTYFYKDGKYFRCDTYTGPQQGPCEIHFQDPGKTVQLVIDPQAGAAPLRLET